MKKTVNRDKKKKELYRYGNMFFLGGNSGGGNIYNSSNWQDNLPNQTSNLEMFQNSYSQSELMPTNSTLLNNTSMQVGMNNAKNFDISQGLGIGKDAAQRGISMAGAAKGGGGGGANAMGAISSGIDLSNQIIGNLHAPKINQEDFTTSSKDTLINQASKFSGHATNQTNVGGAALKGVAAGATFGSAVPVIGTAIGAVAGGIIGLGTSLIGNNRKRKKAARADRKAIRDVNAQNSSINQNLVQEHLSQSFAYGGILPATQGVSEQLALNNNNIFAQGGNLFAYGGDFNNGVNKFSGGGTHEENPYGGIPQGIGENGEPNLVEENEVKWNDYIFSDRLKLDKIEKEMLLPKSLEGKTFAEAAEYFQKESSERELDHISRKGLEANLTKLAIAQEQLKEEEGEESMFKYGGMLEDPNVFAKGGKKKTKSEEELKEEDIKRNELLRRMPIITNALLTSDAMLSDPDTINFNKIAPGRLTQRMKYNPIDNEYIANQMRQQAAGTNRLLLDSSGGNRAIAQAALLSANRGSQDAIGAALLQGDEYNQSKLNQVLDFNRATDQFNIGTDLQAQQYNASISDRETEWNKQAAAQRRNMIREGITGIGTSLGDIGTENRWMNVAKETGGGYDTYGRYNNRGKKKDDEFKFGGIQTFYKKKIK